MRLFIKNMVSIRCKMVVKAELSKMHLNFKVLEFGEVEIEEKICETKYDILKVALSRHGLELMDERTGMIIEKIKMVIVEMIHYSEEQPGLKNSHYISEKLNLSYTYISNLFSEIKGITIEQYIIAHKIERAKELLIYSDLSLTDISYSLHYSSVAHLSSQFKKVTGLTPSFFKKLKHHKFNGQENL
jgi:AraC-like DNA-binding protein